MIIDLTVREVMDLAEASGLELNKTRLPDDHEMETVVCLAKCHPEGLANDDGVTEHFSLVMYFEDCPEEGVIPLGSPLERAPQMSEKQQPTRGTPWPSCRREVLVWHYPAHNLDLPNLPAPGEIVVVYYRKGEEICGPTLMSPVHEDGPPTVAGLSIFQPIVRWCRIPEE